MGEWCGTTPKHLTPHTSPNYNQTTFDPAAAQVIQPSAYIHTWVDLWGVYGEASADVHNILARAADLQSARLHEYLHPRTSAALQRNS